MSKINPLEIYATEGLNLGKKLVLFYTKSGCKSKDGSIYLSENLEEKV